MSGQTIVENKPVELTETEKLKAALAKARDEKINEFVVKEARTAKNFGQMKERAEGAGVSCDELFTALESHLQILMKNQAEQAKKPLKNFVNEHLGGKKNWDELAKTESILRTAAGGCGGATNQEVVSQNPGRRVAVAVLKNLGNDEPESKNEESNTAPQREDSHIEN